MGDISMRPGVPESIGAEPPRDALGRRYPRRIMTFFGQARTIPGFFERFADIPDDYWTADANSDGFTEAVVRCPCGQEPHIEVGLLDECSCGRFFAFLGVKVMVANSPKAG